MSQIFSNCNQFHLEMEQFSCKLRQIQVELYSFTRRKSQFHFTLYVFFSEWLQFHLYLCQLSVGMPKFNIVMAPPIIFSIILKIIDTQCECISLLDKLGCVLNGSFLVNIFLND